MSLFEQHDIPTPHLALIAITPSMLHAEKAGDGSFAQLIHCTIPLNWPPIDWEPHVLDALLAQYERCPSQVAWHRYVAYPHADGTRSLIGALGAFWRETCPAQCEVGYTILPPYEGQGLATEATRALLDLIRNDKHMDPRVTTAIAHTFPRLLDSIRVLEKCGFAPDGMGDEPESVRYRLLL